jgi:hypothetical protein
LIDAEAGNTGVHGTFSSLSNSEGAEIKAKHSHGLLALERSAERHWNAEKAKLTKMWEMERLELKAEHERLTRALRGKISEMENKVQRLKTMLSSERELSRTFSKQIDNLKAEAEMRWKNRGKIASDTDAQKLFDAEVRKKLYTAGDVKGHGLEPSARSSASRMQSLYGKAILHTSKDTGVGLTKKEFVEGGLGSAAEFEELDHRRRGIVHFSQFWRRDSGSDSDGKTKRHWWQRKKQKTFKTGRSSGKAGFARAMPMSDLAREAAIEAGVNPEDLDLMHERILHASDVEAMLKAGINPEDAIREGIRRDNMSWATALEAEKKARHAVLDSGIVMACRRFSSAFS